MRTNKFTGAPSLPTAAATIPCAMKPKRNTKKMEDRAGMEAMLDELLLLKQIIVESKSFRRPDITALLSAV